MKKILAAVVVLGIGGIFFFILSGSSLSQSLQAGDFLVQYEKTADAVLLDVRTPDEFRSGHIEGATNIDFENTSFDSEIQKLDTAKTYFVYCRSGNRSGQAILIMKKFGVKNIYELKGGLVSNQGVLTLVAL